MQISNFFVRRFLGLSISLLFLLCIQSCVSEIESFRRQQDAIVKKIINDNNLEECIVLFFGDSLSISGTNDKVNLSAYPAYQYKSLKFHYEGPAFDFNDLSTYLYHAKYFKITNTSSIPIDYSVLSKHDGIGAICLTNVKREELFSMGELKTDILELYGETLFNFPAEHFFTITKNVKAFVIANIIIEGKDLQLQFDSLLSIRLIGNYQYDFMESSNMPKLRTIELFKMRVNSNIIKHISTKFDNIFLVISGCELESLDVLALLNSQFNRFLIYSSTVINGDLSQYIYILDPINVRH